MQQKKENLIVELTFQLALKIIKYVGLLERGKKFVIANQLLKAATGIDVNVREAQNAESKGDFFHKMNIAAKEADETEYWLLLCSKSDDFQNRKELLTDCTSIIKVLSKIIASSKLKSSTNFQIAKSSN
jgi:four helix bundle protein